MKSITYHRRIEPRYCQHCRGTSPAPVRLGGRLDWKLLIVGMPRWPRLLLGALNYNQTWYIPVAHRGASSLRKGIFPPQRVRPQSYATFRRRCADTVSNGGRRMSNVDYANPGNDGGVLPDDFIPWRWVLSYTVHPELLTPAKLGQERHFVVSVLRKLADGQNPGYADLYERAAAIAKGRASI